MSTQNANIAMAVYAASAVLHVRNNYDIELDFSLASIQHVETIAGELFDARPKGLFKIFKRGPSDEELDSCSRLLGSYVGEVYRRLKGGDWGSCEDFDATGIENDGCWIFPMGKVAKRLRNGPEDNLVSYIEMMIAQPWLSAMSGSNE